MNSFEQSNLKISTPQRFINSCSASCRKLLAAVGKVKDALVAEFDQASAVDEHLLRLALNEAEALAWQTDFPLLVFPSLAREKVERVAAWSSRQHAMLQLPHTAMPA